MTTSQSSGAGRGCAPFRQPYNLRISSLSLPRKQDANSTLLLEQMKKQAETNRAIKAVADERKKKEAEEVAKGSNFLPSSTYRFSSSSEKRKTKAFSNSSSDTDQENQSGSNTKSSSKKSKLDDDTNAEMQTDENTTESDASGETPEINVQHSNYCAIVTPAVNIRGD